jgi:hypothetical protein
METCKLHVLDDDLNRSTEVRSSAITKRASIAKMNDYYPTRLPSVASEQRSMSSISMDSIENKSKNAFNRHSSTATLFEDPLIVRERDQASVPLHQSSLPPAPPSPIPTGLSQLPKLFRSLLKKCSPRSTGSYQLVHNAHHLMNVAEPILLQLSYLDGRRGLVDDNARKALMEKPTPANIKLTVHSNSSGSPKSRADKLSYRKRVFQPFEAIWKSFDT